MIGQDCEKQSQELEIVNFVDAKRMPFAEVIMHAHWHSDVHKIDCSVIEYGNHSALSLT